MCTKNVAVIQCGQNTDFKWMLNSSVVMIFIYKIYLKNLDASRWVRDHPAPGTGVKFQGICSAGGECTLPKMHITHSFHRMIELGRYGGGGHILEGDNGGRSN